MTESVPTPAAIPEFDDPRWVVGSSGPRRVPAIAGIEPDDGGWNSGAMAYEPERLAYPAGPPVGYEPDEYTGDETVGYAVHCLEAFGADLSSDVAAVLLTMWRHNAELTDNERMAIYRRFPRRSTMVAGDPGE